MTQRERGQAILRSLPNLAVHWISERAPNISVRISRSETQEPLRHRLLFLFTDNLKQGLAGGYPEVQEIFFPTGAIQCECLLYQHDVLIRGQHLTILGSARPIFVSLRLTPGGTKPPALSLLESR